MENLSKLSLPEIHKLWQKYTKKPVPKLRKPTLIKHIFWYQQARENKVSLRPFYTLLEKSLKEAAAGGLNSTEEVLFEVGTKLIRSYKGGRYEVEVIKAGFLFEGIVYKSLSAIARKITGAQWNGRIFFRGNNGRK